MQHISITCPHCNNDFELTNKVHFSIPSELSSEFSAEEILHDKLYEMQESVQNTMQEELSRMKIEEERLKKVIDDANARELLLLQKEQSLQQKIDNTDLEIARKVNQQISEIRSTSEMKINLKEQENKLLIGSLTDKIDDLQKKITQGSQQFQGEILEEELASILRTHFPTDSIEEIAKGVRGADVLQKVNNSLGECIGQILWESKNTKEFSSKWIPKLKNDVMDSKADIGIILSNVLPEGVNNIGEIDGIFICNYSSIIGISKALRKGLFGIANQKKNEKNKGDKAVILYEYFTSNIFKQRLELIIHPFIQMKTGLDNEKRAMNKIWKMREKQLEMVIDNIGCFSGELSGITGKEVEISGFILGEEIADEIVEE